MELTLIAQAPGMTPLACGGIVFGWTVFCLFPLAIMSEEPGMTVGGWLQLSVITLGMAWALFRFYRKRTLSRIVTVVLMYPIMTASSNFVGLKLIPDLMH